MTSAYIQHMEKSKFFCIIEGPKFCGQSGQTVFTPPHLKSTHPLLKIFPAHDLAMPNASPH